MMLYPAGHRYPEPSLGRSTAGPTWPTRSCKTPYSRPAERHPNGPRVMERTVLVAAVLVILAVLGTPGAKADTCNNGAVARGSAGDYSICQGGAWQHYPAPTFDPNSGDGYGPNQPLPPACIR